MRTPIGLTFQTEPGYSDMYFVVYEDYAEALQPLAALTGGVPMIPRYALGLWFSGYYPYRAMITGKSPGSSRSSG